MRDYIIFGIDQSTYAIEVEKVERIDQLPTLTAIPNAHPYIDGMMTYQSHTAKVVNFRKMTDVTSYEAQILNLFNQVIKDHQTWVETLEKSLKEGSHFPLALDPHLCRLGKWLYGYTTHDPDILQVIRGLLPVHASLHETGAQLLKMAADGMQEEAIELYEQKIQGDIFIQTMGWLKKLTEQSVEVASHAQKLLMYRSEEGVFAIKVDAIKDFVTLDDHQIKSYSQDVSVGGFLRTKGVVEINKALVMVIDTITLPVGE